MTAQLTRDVQRTAPYPEHARAHTLPHTEWERAARKSRTNIATKPRVRLGGTGAAVLVEGSAAQPVLVQDQMQYLRKRKQQQSQRPVKQTTGRPAAEGKCGTEEAQIAGVGLLIGTHEIPTGCCVCVCIRVCMYTHVYEYMCVHTCIVYSPSPKPYTLHPKP